MTSVLFSTATSMGLLKCKLKTLVRLVSTVPPCNYLALDPLWSRSCCSSVTQVLRLAIDSDIVDAAIKSLRGTVRAGSETCGYHLRWYTWEMEENKTGHEREVKVDKRMTCMGSKKKEKRKELKEDCLITLIHSSCLIVTIQIQCSSKNTASHLLLLHNTFC